MKTVLFIKEVNYSNKPTEYLCTLTCGHTVVVLDRPGLYEKVKCGFCSPANIKPSSY